MTGKDIALTTGGILATMTLAYLFYRLQQRDAAAAAAASSADQAAADTSTIASDAYNTQQLYAESIASLATPVATTPVVTGTTTNTPAAVDTSAAASNGYSYDSTDIQNLLSNIVATFGTSGPIQSGAAPEALDLITIPTIGSGVTQTSLNGIPVTAEEAQAQAMLATGPTTADQSTASFLAAMQSSPLVSSHPVTAHPIVQVGQ